MSYTPQEEEMFPHIGSENRMPRGTRPSHPPPPPPPKLDDFRRIQLSPPKNVYDSYGLYVKRVGETLRLAREELTKMNDTDKVEEIILQIDRCLVDFF